MGTLDSRSTTRLVLTTANRGLWNLRVGVRVLATVGDVLEVEGWKTGSNMPIAWETFLRMVRKIYRLLIAL